MKSTVTLSLEVRLTSAVKVAGGVWAVSGAWVANSKAAADKMNREWTRMDANNWFGGVVTGGLAGGFFRGRKFSWFRVWVMATAGRAFATFFVIDALVGEAHHDTATGGRCHLNFAAA
jgi:hypothetical protein